MKKKFLIILLLTLLFIPKKINANELLIDDAKSAILIEAKSGKVIYKYNENQKLLPASMTKIMTLLLTMEAIDNNIINKDDDVVISKHAKSMGGTTIFLEEGEVIKVEDLIKGASIASANDAAVALAEKINQTELNFVSHMNQKVKDLDLKNTNFKNATGFYDKDHYTSSYDIASISRELINKYPDILNYTKIYEDYLRKGEKNEVWLVNTNKLVRHYPGIDGLKTGWIKESGYCLTATMEKNGTRLIAVVMGASSADSRNTQIKRLLEYGFNNYKYENVKNKDDFVLDYKNILLSPYKNEILLDKDLVIMENKSIDLKQIKYEYILDEARIKEYNKNNIGRVKVYYDNKLYEEINLNFKYQPKKNNVVSIFFTTIKNVLNL